MGTRIQQNLNVCPACSRPGDAWRQDATRAVVEGILLRRPHPVYLEPATRVSQTSYTLVWWTVCAFFQGLGLLNPRCLWEGLSKILLCKRTRFASTNPYGDALAEVDSWACKQVSAWQILSSSPCTWHFRPLVCAADPGGSPLQLPWDVESGELGAVKILGMYPERSNKSRTF